jgi:hypothetical protein
VRLVGDMEEVIEAYTRSVESPGPALVGAA